MRDNKAIIIIYSLFICAVTAISTVGVLTKNSHEYQLDATPKGYILYSGNERLGFIRASNTVLDSLIENHNQ